MKFTQVTQLIFKLRLWCRHIGWSNALAFAICVSGSAAWLWGVPYLKQQRITSQIKLQQIQTALNLVPEAKTTEPTQSEQHLNNFYSALGEINYVEQQVASLFALANKNGLALHQADYKLAQNKNGRFYTYTVTFPVIGQYKVIRQFGEQVLQSIPFAALDEISFKRSSIENDLIETRLRLTFYLNSVQDIGNKTSVLPLIKGN
jgi:hypothetical protein